MAYRFEPAFQGFENLFLTEIGKLFPETLEVAEGMLVNETDQTEKFEERVLQRRCRQ